jgi:hypothetical protein
MQDFTTTFTVDRAPAEVVAAISDVRAWWTGQIDGSADALGDEFTYAYADLHRSVQRVTAHGVEGIDWSVLEGGPNFTDAANEWGGTVIRFALLPVGSGTEVRFTHVGLSPQLECYDACSPAWAGFAEALQRFIATGEHNDAPPVGA